MLKVVIDTNVLIDSDRGDFAFATRILEAILSKEIEAFVDHRIEREARYKVPELVHDLELQNKIVNYFSTATRVEKVTRLGRLTADPDDDKFLELASQVGADYVVTSDHHLLDIETFDGAEIIRPDAFWRVVEDQRDPEGSHRWQSWFSGISRDELD